jgi:hypothetical protein
MLGKILVTKNVLKKYDEGRGKCGMENTYKYENL